MKTNIIVGDKIISKLQFDLGSNTWPIFMQHDKIVNKCWENLYSDFLDFQYALYEGDNLLGIGNSIPLNWHQSFFELSDSGLDWAMEKAIDDYRLKIDSNILIGVQILVNPAY